MTDLTSLDTSRKLKKAGLPQGNEEYRWWEAAYCDHPYKGQREVVAYELLHPSQDPAEYLCYKRRGRYAEIECVARAFSADELMQEWEEGVSLVCLPDNTFQAKTFMKVDGNTLQAIHSNAAEAVAALILQEGK